MLPKSEDINLDLSIMYALVEKLKVAEKRVADLKMVKAPVAEMAVALSDLNGLISFIMDESKAVLAESKGLYNIMYVEQKASGMERHNIDLGFSPLKPKKSFD